MHVSSSSSHACILLQPVYRGRVCMATGSTREHQGTPGERHACACRQRNAMGKQMNILIHISRCPSVNASARAPGFKHERPRKRGAPMTRTQVHRHTCVRTARAFSVNEDPGIHGAVHTHTDWRVAGDGWSPSCMTKVCARSTCD